MAAPEFGIADLKLWDEDELTEEEEFPEYLPMRRSILNISR
jgi:hypothetical protein